MSIVVQKYGGSSVADLERLGRVADRVVATAVAGHGVVVVVSAMGKTTDQLFALARQVTESPPRRELDMLVSAGERIAMSLLAMAIAARGREAISFTGSQSGIITDERHTGARILEVRPMRIQDELAKGRIVIVAGFQGVSRQREITTLGRGGSDTTAVALAAALGAEACEICSDVDGVLTADPKVVPEARRLEDIGYDEMQELATHGAKVLNAQAVEWARRAGIEIVAMATTASGGGTKVHATAAGDARVTGVTSSKDVVRLTLPSASAERLLPKLAAAGVAVRTITEGPPGCIVTFGSTDLPDWPSLRADLLASSGAGVTLRDDLASVSIVGHGVGANARNLSDVIALAHATGKPLGGIEATALRVSVYVDSTVADDLVRALHHRFLA